MPELSEPYGFDDEFTTEHAHLMLDFYGKTLVAQGFEARAYPDVDEHIGANRLQTPKFDTLNHALWMCAMTREFLRQGRLAKAYRWIGTIQGILLVNGVFSISELKGHNRIALPPVNPRGR
ncbi:MAG: hypothetical protein Q7W44_01775 [Coriobacteriia bacterium]|nr:hypothetical protein [Coriobacteriia bacterium]